MTTPALKLAKKLFLDPAELDNKAIEKLLSSIGSHAVDDADLYFQSCQQESWYLEESEVKSGHYGIDRGVGVRAVNGEKTGYAYCEDMLLPAIERAAGAAQSIATQNQTKKVSIKLDSSSIQRYSTLNPLDELNSKEKIALLHAVDKAARQASPHVTQVNASLSASHEVVMIAGLQGQFVADVRPMVHLSVHVMVEKDGRRESARTGGGGRVAFRFFLEDERALGYAHEAVRLALNNLEAEDAPAGVMPVVLGSGWPGILLHEAVGHGLEGDFNRKGLSAFSGRIGERVASPGVTVVDDGTIPDRRGSLSVDDEGTPTQRTVLIDDGVLVSYMQDKLNASLMGMPLTGNCRRESYASVPMPRMTNTFMLNGQYPPEEIIRSVKKGLYAVNFAGGQVDITSGQFVFSTNEAYLIENGCITRPVKDATLIGSGPDVMKKISMIGNDMKLDPGVGTCGKAGQSVPVCVGQPTIKVDGLTVGGTKGGD